MEEWERREKLLLREGFSWEVMSELKPSNKTMSFNISCFFFYFSRVFFILEHFREKKSPLPKALASPLHSNGRGTRASKPQGTSAVHSSAYNTSANISLAKQSHMAKPMETGMGETFC